MMSLPPGSTPQDRSGTQGPRLSAPDARGPPTVCVGLARRTSALMRPLFHASRSPRPSQQEGDAGAGEDPRKLLKRRSNL